jgi:hypothetical protein
MAITIITRQCMGDVQSSLFVYSTNIQAYATNLLSFYITTCVLQK